MLPLPLVLALAAAAPPVAPVAVVELFTSEGCSSCPPADAVLAELAKDPRVIALGFHVDYWDGLGWKDPLSSPASSARQHEYARALGRGDYTPQMVVNGAREFVGSDGGAARAAVKAALADPQPVRVTLTPEDGAVTFKLEGAGDVVAHLFVVEDGVVHQVPRGENAGRTLRHARAVREQRALTGTEGSVAISTKGAAAVAIVVQDRKTRAVIGAAQVPVRSAR